MNGSDVNICAFLLLRVLRLFPIQHVGAFSLALYRILTEASFFFFLAQARRVKKQYGSNKENSSGR